MKKLLLLLFVLSALCSKSQEIKNYAWEANPSFQELSEDLKQEPAVILFDKRWIHTRVGEYAYASFVMNHLAVKINKKEVINKFNKVSAEDRNYIRKTRDFHARIIKPDGSIKIIPPSSIVEAEVNKTKSIVFEGVEEGDILEYYYILKENPVSSGVEVYQSEAPVLFAQLTTTSSGVDFHIYPTPAFTKQEQGSKTIYTAKNLPAYKPEYRSADIRNIEKIVFFLTLKGYPPTYWNRMLAQSTIPPKTFKGFRVKHAKKLLEKLNVATLPVDKQLETIDNYIKVNFGFYEDGQKQNRITDLCAGKMLLDSDDVFALYSFFLHQLKIPYELVVSVDRQLGEVNRDIYLYPMPHIWMLYIPETNKYISPFSLSKSYGAPRYEVQGALSVSYNGTGSKSVNISNIGSVDAANNMENNVVEVKLNEELTGAIVKTTAQSTGYRGEFDRRALQLLAEENDKEKTEDFMKNRFLHGLPCKLISFDTENTEFHYNYSSTPLTINGLLEIEDNFVENAGDMIVVNLGKVIGIQTDLFQEEERHSDLDMDFAHRYKRKITFQIPEGYKVESFEEMKKSVKPLLPETEACWFVSTVEVNENQIVIDIDESYNNYIVPVARYQDYRAVVNAAADFFKGSVVLSKIQ